MSNDPQRDMADEMARLNARIDVLGPPILLCILMLAVAAVSLVVLTYTYRQVHAADIQAATKDLAK